MIEIVDKAFREKAAKHLENVLSSLDSALEDLAKLDGRIKKVTEEAKSSLSQKLEDAVQKIELEPKIDEKSQEKLNKVLSDYLVTISTHRKRTAYGYQDNYLVPILASKLKSRVEKMELS